MLRRSLRHGKSAPLAAALLVAAWALAPAAPALAQLVDPRAGQDAAASSALAPLPEARSSSHGIAVGGRELRFTAKAGALALGTAVGDIQADVAYVAYELAGGDPATRPIVFAFNGGPGSASTWLHLGAMGPWRVGLTAETIAGKAPPDLVDNTETWLDLADLVFIDPPGTGHSRIWPPGANAQRAGGIYRDLVTPRESTERRAGPRGRGRQTGGPEWYWSVEGDATAFAEFIAAWLERHGRRGSPVVLVGESYGGFRAPLIAEILAARYAVKVGSMVLVSPVLDFDGRRGWRSPLGYMALLPSIAATKLERGGGVPTRALLAEVEAFAGGQYMVDLVAGPRDVAAIRRLSERIAGFSGIPQETVEKHAGRLTIRSFVEALPVPANSLVSIYDAGMTELVSRQGGGRGGVADPFTAGLNQPLTTAMGALYERLGWKSDRPYAVLAGEVSRRWRWPNAPHAPQVVSVLHELHRNDPRLRTLVVHGFTDLVTPYFASVLQLDQMPAHGPLQRIGLEVYPGGHMFYNRDESRRRFRTDAARVIGEAFGNAAGKPAGETRETP